MKKLSLHRETLRALDEQRAGEIGAGLAMASGEDCFTMFGSCRCLTLVFRVCTITSIQF